MTKFQTFYKGKKKMVNKYLACPTEDGLKQYFVCMHYFIAWLVQNLNSKNILWHSKITRTVCFKKNNNIMRHQNCKDENLSVFGVPYSAA